MIVASKETCSVERFHKIDSDFIDAEELSRIYFLQRLDMTMEIKDEIIEQSLLSKDMPLSKKTII